MLCQWFVFDVGLNFAFCEYVPSGKNPLAPSAGLTLKTETPAQHRHLQVSNLSPSVAKEHAVMQREPLKGYAAHARGGPCNVQPHLTACAEQLPAGVRACLDAQLVCGPLQLAVLP